MTVGVKGYEVYVCKKDGEIVYIGEGKFGRHKHCNSGTSHVYELNKLHFEGVELEVKVVKVFETKQDAEHFEKLLIDEHQPIYNSKGKVGYVPIAVVGSEVGVRIAALKKSLEYDLRTNRFTRSKVEEVMGILEEFLNYVGRENVLRGSYKLRGKGYYSKLGLLKLNKLMRYIASIDSVSKWSELFFKNVYVHTKVNLAEQLYTKTDEVGKRWQNFILENKLDTLEP